MAMFILNHQQSAGEQIFTVLDGSANILYYVSLEKNLMGISVLKEVVGRLTRIVVDIPDSKAKEIADLVTPDGVDEIRPIKEIRYVLKLAKG
ncbi:hypothetical protein AGENTSMITH_175 [Bacillus phage vB_BspM_AgentSmith]|nr:hypothetical protein AGENTSMITH_175 [Bacillus phage vB_BspM_AgentSmith]